LFSHLLHPNLRLEPNPTGTKIAGKRADFKVKGGGDILILSHVTNAVYVHYSFHIPASSFFARNHDSEDTKEKGRVWSGSRE
jgi:hypothetical protein